MKGKVILKVTVLCVQMGFLSLGYNCSVTVSLCHDKRPLLTRAAIDPA